MAQFSHNSLILTGYVTRTMYVSLVPFRIKLSFVLHILVVVVVVVAFPSLERTDHSPPAFFFLKWRLARAN